MADTGPIELGRQRAWVPDIRQLAAELLTDLARNTVAAQIGENGLPFGDVSEAGNVGDLDAIGTFEEWEDRAKRHGEEIQADDYQSLAIHLARICLGQIPMPDAETAEDSSSTDLAPIDIDVQYEANQDLPMMLDGRPKLFWGRHPSHGSGWTLLYLDDPTSPTAGAEEYFIPGDLTEVDVAEKSARQWLERHYEPD